MLAITFHSNGTVLVSAERNISLASDNPILPGWMSIAIVLPNDITAI